MSPTLRPLSTFPNHLPSPASQEPTLELILLVPSPAVAPWLSPKLSVCLRDRESEREGEEEGKVVKPNLFQGFNCS